MLSKAKTADRPILVADVQVDGNDDFGSVEIELSLQAKQQSLVEAPDLAGEYDEYLEHLLYLIVLKPKDLESHVRRVFLAYQKGTEEHLYAALLDFLIALDGLGPSLWARMFHQVSVVFANQMLNYFVIIDDVVGRV